MNAYEGFDPELQINMYLVASHDYKNQPEQQQVYRGADW